MNPDCTKQMTNPDCILCGGEGKIEREEWYRIEPYLPLIFEGTGEWAKCPECKEEE